MTKINKTVIVTCSTSSADIADLRIMYYIHTYTLTRQLNKLLFAKIFSVQAIDV